MFITYKNLPYKGIIRLRQCQWLLFWLM
jgi:hypothetical protein